MSQQSENPHCIEFKYTQGYTIGSAVVSTLARVVLLPLRSHDAGIWLFCQDRPAFSSQKPSKPTPAWKSTYGLAISGTGLSVEQS